MTHWKLRKGGLPLTTAAAAPTGSAAPPAPTAPAAPPAAKP